MKIRNLFLTLLCVILIAPLSAKVKTKVIAHRGYWQCEGSAQNSIKSLEKTAEIKAWGAEFDVHLTSDNVPVVFHDNKVSNMVIQDVTYDSLKNLKLANGEFLPTLDEYLEKGKAFKKTKLIFELKSHATPERNREAAAMAVERVKKYKLKKQTEYITFNLDAGKEIIRLDKKAKVSYLNGELSPKELKELGFSGLDYQYNVMLKHPEWFKEAKDLGLTVNVWTVDDPQIMKQMINYGADYITTNKPVELQQILQN